ncbi:MAG: transporter [Kibdelosporangium sp.]
MRILLTLGIAVFFVLCVLAMWWGYRNRARRQDAVLPEFPRPPADLGTELLEPTTGVYISTTTSNSWQDRVAIGDIGFRAAATLHLTGDGLLLDREGADRVWIPADSVVSARTDRAIAGKVMARDGLLVVRWRLGEHELDTGFRGDDKDVYADWVEALRSLAEGGAAK